MAWNKIYFLLLCLLSCYCNDLIGQVVVREDQLINAIATFQVLPGDCLYAKTKQSEFYFKTVISDRRVFPDSLQIDENLLTLNTEVINFSQHKETKVLNGEFKGCETVLFYQEIREDTLEAFNLSPEEARYSEVSLIEEGSYWGDFYQKFMDEDESGTRDLMERPNNHFTDSIRALYSHLYSEKWLSHRAAELAKKSPELYSTSIWKSFLEKSVLNVDDGSVFNRVWVSQVMTIGDRQFVAVFKSFEYFDSFVGQYRAECFGDDIPAIYAPQLSFYQVSKSPNKPSFKEVQTIDFREMGDGACHAAMVELRILKIGPTKEPVVTVVTTNLDRRYYENRQLYLFFTDLPIPENQPPPYLGFEIHRLNQKD